MFVPNELNSASPYCLHIVSIYKGVTIKNGCYKSFEHFLKLNYNQTKFVMLQLNFNLFVQNVFSAYRAW